MKVKVISRDPNDFLRETKKENHKGIIIVHQITDYFYKTNYNFSAQKL